MRSDVHDLMGAYVLDAVDAPERTAFEDHLDRCDSCRSELVTLRAASAALAPYEEPPARLRVNVLTAIEELEGKTSRLPRLSMPWLVTVAAAIGILLAVALNAVIDRTSQPPGAEEIFAASDVQLHEVETSHGAVQVAVSNEHGMAAVDFGNLVELPEGQVYQTWWVVDDQPISLGVSQAHAVTQMRPGVLAVTVEPAGGSEQPTTEPFVALEVDDSSVTPL